MKRAARPSPAFRAVALAGRGAALAGRGARAGGLVLARRPILSAGLTAFVVLFGSVAANALYGQHARHNNPILITRGPATGSQLAARQPGPSGVQPVPLVREVQEALAGKGYYSAAIDGLPGKATSDAIRAFQAANGLAVDGAPTPLLLSQLRQLSGSAPSPSPRPDPRQTASISERMHVPAAKAPDNSTDQAEPGEVEERFAELSQGELVKKIQTALTNAQVAKLQADGIPGEKTRAAIRTFQALEGMKVTGEPDAELLEHLAEVGIVH
ncbi:peptidoglycan-binding protein [Aurantimonas sp. VKM B-3413]|uniref:peptidoglycan-binding domain-containing protein n=1 Tax=Aurantimonas sp. VKM B-3413 TaxID=2779401 RepID=UPI001E611BED|nr:peptidoglycan-binding domain-containing protein [Aurantimonas sp. VKM B-3413]MCB8838860.1 peptidoglycan-binding protein [Aurantimonas sp. VKM B-3413]